MKVISQSSISAQTELKSIWKLPNFPLTEQYGNYSENFKTYDQELLFCPIPFSIEVSN